MRKFLILFKLNVQNTLEYRGDMIIFAISSFVLPLLSLALWLGASSDNNLFYNYSELILYFLLVLVMTSITGTWASWFISNDIRTGDVSKYLIKPYNLYISNLANNIGEKIFKSSIAIFVTFVIGSFLLYNKPLETNISFLSVLLFLISTVLALLIAANIDFLIGITAFWLHDNDFLNTFLIMFNTFLSGRFIPLIFMPGLILALATVLPFRYIISFPIEVLLNKLILSDLLWGFAFQITWFVITYGAFNYLYYKGTKKYEGYGA